MVVHASEAVGLLKADKQHVVYLAGVKITGEIQQYMSKFRESKYSKTRLLTLFWSCPSTKIWSIRRS